MHPFLLTNPGGRPRSQLKSCTSYILPPFVYEKSVHVSKRIHFTPFLSLRKAIPIFRSRIANLVLLHTHRNMSVAVCIPPQQNVSATYRLLNARHLTSTIFPFKTDGNRYLEKKTAQQVIIVGTTRNEQQLLLL